MAITINQKINESKIDANFFYVRLTIINSHDGNMEVFPFFYLSKQQYKESAHSTINSLLPTRLTQTLYFSDKPKQKLGVKELDVDDDILLEKDMTLEQIHEMIISKILQNNPQIKKSSIKTIDIK